MHIANGEEETGRKNENDDLNAKLLVKMKILHVEEERQSWDYLGETGFVIFGIRS